MAENVGDESITDQLLAACTVLCRSLAIFELCGITADAALQLGATCRVASGRT